MSESITNGRLSEGDDIDNEILKEQLGIIEEGCIIRHQEIQQYDVVRTDFLQPYSLPTVLRTLKMLYGRPDAIFNDM